MSEYKKPKELSGIGVFVNALYDNEILFVSLSIFTILNLIF